MFKLKVGDYVVIRGMQRLARITQISGPGWSTTAYWFEGFMGAWFTEEFRPATALDELLYSEE